MRAHLLGTAGLLLLAAGLGQADPKKDAGRIARLIEQLGDDSFHKREEASKALEAIGKPAVRALLKAVDSSSDLEIRHRAGRILQTIAARLPNLVQKGEEVHRIAWPGVHAYHTTFSPGGRFFLAGGDGNRLRLYEVKTGKHVRDLVGHTHWTQDAVFTPDGKQVLSASVDGTMRLWEVATGKEVRRFDGPEGGCHSIDLTSDGKWAVTGGVKEFHLWEVATGKQVRKFTGHTDRCMAVFSADGKRILSAGFDGTMRLWDTSSGKELRTFKGHTALLLGAFFLPGGKEALSYSTDQTARIWDLATGKEVRQIDFGPQVSNIRGLALSRDGKRILVGCDTTRTVRLLELATGKEVKRFRLVTKPRGLSFSRDGRFAASGSWRGVVHLWRMPGIFDLD
jgi:WD40 repeat protein